MPSRSKVCGIATVSLLASVVINGIAAIIENGHHNEIAGNINTFLAVVSAFVMVIVGAVWVSFSIDEEIENERDRFLNS